jgi:hypothetical protein
MPPDKSDRLDRHRRPPETPPVCIQSGRSKSRPECALRWSGAAPGNCPRTSRATAMSGEHQNTAGIHCAREVEIAQQQRNHRALGGGGDECRTGGGALVNIGRPQMEGHNSQLEADAGNGERNPGQEQVNRGPLRERSRSFARIPWCRYRHRSTPCRKEGTRRTPKPESNT